MASTRVPVGRGAGPRRVVSLRQVWLVLPLAFAFSYASSIPLKLTDLYYHLLDGRLMVEQGSLGLKEAATSPTTTEPLLYAPWLAQLFYYTTMRMGGPEALSLLHSLAALAAFGAVLSSTYEACRREAGPRASAQVAAFATLASLAVASTNLAPRPQTLALLPFAVCLLLLRRFAAQGWALWLVAPLVALWANLHGSFVLGPALVAFFLLGSVLRTGLSAATRSSEVRRLAALLPLAFAAALANPYGAGAYPYVMGIGANETIRTYLVEWRATSLDQLTGQLFFGSLALVAGALWAARGRLAATDWLLLVGLFSLGLLAQRSVVWWALAAPTALAAPVAKRWQGVVSHDRSTAELGGVNLAVAAAALTLAAFTLPWLKGNHPLLPPELRSVLDPERPQAMVDFLKDRRARGVLFARLEWGGFLNWELWPSMWAALDARVELRPREVWEDYFAILSGRPDWESRLARFSPDYVAIDRSFSPGSLSLMAARPGWAEVYSDHQVVVFQPRPPP